ncbi:MAG TPA: immunoglobulin domain-containing protein, partial [Flavobacteriales bacterium]|nr:immunoglobulin domain-containing protein [Flavobacteriales bacterium]
ILATIPTPSGFPLDNGPTATSIGDGCSDMYDGGNFLNTNLGTGLAYTNSVITPSALLGTGGQYFTTTLGSTDCSGTTAFFWVGDINGLSSVSITGNLGADGSGTQASTSFTVSANGVTYTVFNSRVFGAGDPSINHLFLIPQPNSASQTLGTTADENHVISGLTGVNRFVYMLYAGAAGAEIGDAAAQTIAQAVANSIPTATITGYSWAPPTFLNNTNIQNPLASGVTATTTYTVTATASSTCTNTGTVTVTLNSGAALAVTAGTASPTSFCEGGSASLTGTVTNGCPPYTYSWSNGVTQVATTQNYTATTSGSYTLTVTDFAGTVVTSTPAITITVNPRPVVSASAGLGCIGSTLQLNGTHDIGTSFTWTGPNSFSSALQNPTIASATAAATGTYTFTATSASTCVSLPATVAVTMNARPNFTSVTATPPQICSGNNSQLNAVATISGYVVGSTGTSFIDISSSGTAIAGISDDSEHNLTIPSFTFNGVAYTTARVGMNGAIAFGSTSGEITHINATLPTTGLGGAGNAFLAPWWDD